MKYKDPETVKREVITENEYGLEPGEKIKYRIFDGGHYANGTITKNRSIVNDDGSINIAGDKRESRSVMPEHIQQKKVGTRGGTSWSNLTGELGATVLGDNEKPGPGPVKATRKA